MNLFENFFVELLQGEIIYDNQSVEVRRTFLPSAVLPCITLEIVSTNVINTFRSYDTREREYARCECNINIHTWCNTEEQRESINEQVTQCLILADNHHYKYCSNYNKENKVCSTVSRVCEATTNNKCHFHCR